MKRRDYLGELGIEIKTILKFILKVKVKVK